MRDHAELNRESQTPYDALSTVPVRRREVEPVAQPFSHLENVRPNVPVPQLWTPLCETRTSFRRSVVTTRPLCPSKCHCPLVCANLSETRTIRLTYADCVAEFRLGIDGVIALNRRIPLRCSSRLANSDMVQENPYPTYQ